MPTSPYRDPAPNSSAVPPAARSYQGRRAGVVSRVIAMVVDLLVVVGVLVAVYAIWTGLAFLLHPRSFHFPDGLGWSIPAVGFVVAVPYLTLTWHATGRSYGAALLGLRVVGRDGRRLRFVIALLRAVICALFPIGLLWVAVSPANRSVQDILLRTSVVYDWTPSADAALP
jgi:uncharacterized RDD family membrane protein YckC